MTSHLISVTVEESGAGVYTQTVLAGRHQFIADEPGALGGLDKGPAPYELLLSSLGACTSMTLRMYANRKGWSLEKITVTLTHRKETDATNSKVDVIERSIKIDGDLDDEQRRRLLDIADKCPVHRTLTDETRPVVKSVLV